MGIELIRHACLLNLSDHKCRVAVWMKGVDVMTVVQYIRGSRKYLLETASAVILGFPITH